MKLSPFVAMLYTQSEDCWVAVSRRLGTMGRKQRATIKHNLLIGSGDNEVTVLSDHDTLLTLETITLHSLQE
jgi:hypothetical protein